MRRFIPHSAIEYVRQKGNKLKRLFCFSTNSKSTANVRLSLMHDSTIGETERLLKSEDAEACQGILKVVVDDLSIFD